MTTPADMERVAKPGDRIRCIKFPGVSAEVLAIEQHPKYGLVYRVRAGFWLPSTVTVERAR